MSESEKEWEQKFKAIYHSYINKIYQFVYLRTGFDPALAEDLTQDIFLNVFQGLAGFRGICSERTWIYKIARNKLNDFYRRQYRQAFDLVEIDSELADSLEDPSQDVQEVMLKTLERQGVKTCLEGLQRLYRIVLVLKYMDERSIKDIADIIGKSPKAAESILQRAKKAFIKSYMQYQDKEGMQ